MMETDVEHKARMQKQVRARFGPKGKEGNYKQWHYAEQGSVWDAMRELEYRIKVLEATVKRLGGKK